MRSVTQVRLGILLIVFGLAALGAFAVSMWPYSSRAKQQTWAQCTTEAERAFAGVSGLAGLTGLDVNIHHCMDAHGFVWRMDKADCRALKDNVFGAVDATCFRRAPLF